MTRLGGALLALAATALPARAEIVWLPHLALKASPDGKADFTASAGARFDAWTDTDLSVRASYQVTTNKGVATLLGLSSGDLQATRPWQAGVTASLVWLAVPAGPEVKTDAWTKAVAACTPGCADKEKSTEEKDFCDAKAHARVPTDISRAKMCKAGRDIIDEWQKNRPDLRKHPVLVVNGGLRAGESSLSFLDGDAAHLKPAGPRSYANLTTGVSAIGLLGASRRTMTIEGFAAFKHAFEEGDPAHFCAVVGGVDTAAGTVPAEACSDTPVGAPTSTRSVSTALFLGLFDQAADSWRVSAGIQPDFPLGGTGKRRIELSMPVTFSLASTSLDYKGLVRVGPSIVWSTPRGKDTQMSFGITIAVLGQRLLFSEEFDQL
ncbi:MAG: hypothetical protein ACJ79H_22455 [Myxococcales bacterium]